MVELYTPIFRVEVDGVNRTDEIWRCLESLEYTDSEGGESDTVNIAVTNSPAFSIPRRGAELRLWFGWKEASMKFFGSFIVDEVSGQINPANMSISAKSADVSAKSNAKSKKDIEWENISLADLTSKIAAKHNCKSKVMINAYYSYQAQTQESDIAFLKRLSQEAGATLAIKDKTFVIVPCGKAVRVKSAISCKDIISGSWTLQEREKYTSVTARWWDAQEAEEKQVVSGDGDTSYIIRKRFANAQEAQMAAENYKTKLSKGEFSLNITLVGTPEIVSGSEVFCQDFSPKELNATYLIKSVTHRISKQEGWITEAALDRIS